MRSRNSADATGATVPPSAPGERHGLGLRVASALVLAPPVLGVLYLGPPYSDVLVVAVAGLAAWEWARLCRRGALDLAGGLAVAAVLGATAAGSLGLYAVAAGLVVLGALGASVAARGQAWAEALWLGLGVVYLAAACLAFLWLRQDPEHGRALVFWLIAVVWSTDVCAYFAGRAIGGPRLAPVISPHKTWAGLGGGVAGAALVGAAAAWWLGGAQGRWIALSAALAIAAQVGDLFESSLKRRFGAKDSGALIPGHGGVLDRIDGLLAAALMVGGIAGLTQGGALTWP